MFPKKQRLSKQKDFDHLYRRGRTIFGPLFNIKYLSNKLDYPRVAIVVGKKVHLHATERNLIKRRVRASLKNHASKINGFDLVFLTKKPITKSSFTEINNQVALSLKHLKRF